MQPDDRPRLAATVAPIGEPREAIAFLASAGIPAVQLSATQAGVRPRDLDASARRDLRAMLARLALEVAGIDLWIPPEHFVDPAHAERAVDAVRAACELASFLGRVSVTLALPARGDDAARAARRDEAASLVSEAAEHHGVRIAEAGGDRQGLRCPPIGVSVDPAASLALGADPAAAVAAAAGTIEAARVVDLLRSGLRGPLGTAGESRLDVLGYRIALELAGFTGFPVIDARQWSDPRAGVRQTAAAWQAALPRLG